MLPYKTARINKTIFKPLGLKSNIISHHYSFNDFGFRDHRNFAHLEQRVVDVCIGDSFVVNVADSYEHSWPYIMNTKSDIPVLNLGISGAGNDMLCRVVDYALTHFNVRNIYIQFTFLHRYYNIQNGIIVFNNNSINDSENFNRFQHAFNTIHKHKNVKFTFLYDIFYTYAEYQFILQYFTHPNYVPFPQPSYTPYYYKDYKNIVDNDKKRFVLEESYNNLRSSNWHTYNEFINSTSWHPDMMTEDFGNFISNIEIIRHTEPQWFNSDNYHFSHNTNLNIANNFFNSISTET